ncbi:MAG: MFS transporter [Actinomycetota bacterium]|nr:MFS transporter [Actinomycetota bacterium]
MRERIRVFAAIFRDPNLLRIELAFAGFNMAEYATWIAILVYAYERGGATAAGVVALIQLIPAGLIAPFASYSADRFRKERVLLVDYLVQAAAMAGTAAALFLEAPVVVVYATATLAAVSLTFTRPAQASLLPEITNSPEDLTAANVASGMIESVGIFVGPFIAGIILRVSEPAMVFAVMSGIALVGALAIRGLRLDPAAAPPREGFGVRMVLRETLAGFRVLRTERDPRLLIGVTSAQLVVVGALDVLFVAAAIDLLGLGQGGAGFLNSAYGVGGILGAASAVMLVGRRRLTPPLAGGAAVCGVPLMVTGALPSALTAPFLIAVGGSGRSLSDVSARTLLQRIAPDEVLARVFGVLEGMGMLALAAGSIGASAVVAAFGIKTALVVTGAFMPAVVFLALRRLLAIDAAARAPDPIALEFLRRIPIFAPLPAPSIERIAANLIAVSADAGDVIIRQGDAGDRFYVVVEGEAEVRTDGRFTATLGSGSYFGEIALLKDVPRTATVAARSAMRLLALERAPFLEAVTGHPRSIEAADEVVRARTTH